MLNKEKEYVILRQLGKGTFGLVFLAEDQEGNKYAIKRIKKVGEQLSREVEILREIQDNPYCVKMIEIFYSKAGNGNLVQNMVFEFLDMDLMTFIQTKQKMNQKIKLSEVKKITYQIFKGLEILDKKNIVHRDLKLENILLDKKGNVRICDFGSAKILDKNGKNSPYVVSQFYRAPELFLCLVDYDGKIDVWSAACILVELIIEEPLFMGKNEGDQFFEIIKSIGNLSKEDKNFYLKKSPFLKKLFKQIPQFTIRKNYLQNVLNQVTRKKDKEELQDLLENIFVHNPKNRLNAKQVLQHKFFESLRNQNNQYTQNTQTQYLILFFLHDFDQIFFIINVNIQLQVQVQINNLYYYY